MVGSGSPPLALGDATAVPRRGCGARTCRRCRSSLDALIDELADDDHGLIMCMGKGGVGKTTLAAAIAVALAQRGHQVHLTTTDPAAHLDTHPWR